VFSSPMEHVGGLKMAAPASHHVDLKIEPHYKVCSRLRFQTKLSHESQESYVYARGQGDVERRQDHFQGELDRV
jgi:hypothetical protein